MVTTAWVLTEVANSIAKSERRTAFGELYHAVVFDEQTTFVPASDALFRLGIERYNLRPDKSWSLTDCISFVVMEQHDLSDALTGDHHFEQAGFRALLRSHPAT
ncbi:MAG: PIN domain-containing protein [Phycisphaerae bacterium]|nr:PIN domain-containing protein [Phycisphaerae bacterium]